MRIWTRALFGCTVALGAIVLVAGLGPAPAVPPRAPATPIPVGVAARPYIKHVVVIVQENRSFDNLFGGYVHGSPGGPLPYPRADSTVPPKVIAYLTPEPIDGTSADNHHDTWECLNQSHPFPRFSTEQWIAVSKQAGPAQCKTGGDYNFFRYVPQSQRTIYWQIAQRYGLGDNFFAATSSASFPPHQFLVAGDVSFSYPAAKLWWVADQPSPGSGCFTALDATSSAPVISPSGFSEIVTVPHSFAATCYDRPTYGDQLTAANVNWVHYTTNLPTIEGVYDGFINIKNWYTATNSGSNPHFVPATQVLSVGKHEKLQAFSWVKPPCQKQSDHPGLGGHNGPNWVGSVINAIGSSSYWDSTVIFVLWDDWGGFYDHVVPPLPPYGRLGRGVRVPFLVVSPYLAKQGAVVHTVTHPGSIMRFVDDLFAAEPLTGFDGSAPQLDGWFDFTASPRPFVPIPAASAVPWAPAMCNGSPAGPLED
jgi:phospholipase C